MRLNQEEKRELYLKLILVFFAIVIYFSFYKINSIMSFFNLFLSASRPIILGLSLAFVVNMLLNGIEKILLNKFKIKNRKLVRTISLFGAYIAFMAILIFVLSIVIPEVIQTVVNLIYQLPKIFDEWVRFFQEKELLKDYIPIIEEYISNINTTKIANYAIDFISGQAGHAFTGTINIIQIFLSSFIESTLIIIFSMYALSKKEELSKNSKKVLYSFVSEKFADGIMKVLRLLYKNFYNFFTGQFIEAILLACIVMVGMTILNMPYIIMIAVMTGFLNIIPYFGSLISGVLGTVIILIVNPFKGLIYFVFISLVQQFDGNVIYPRLVGKKVGIPSFWIIVSITLGGALFGMVGMVTFVPIMSTVYMLLKEFTDKKLKSKEIDIDTK